jgi:hypothetical protein
VFETDTEIENKHKDSVPTIFESSKNELDLPRGQSSFICIRTHMSQRASEKPKYRMFEKFGTRIF